MILSGCMKKPTEPVNQDLSWLCGDIVGNKLTYDVYFGINPVPDSGELLSANQSASSCISYTIRKIC